MKSDRQRVEARPPHRPTEAQQLGDGDEPEIPGKAGEQDLERDLVPITGVSDAPIVLAANSGSPFKSVADVIAAAKKDPGSVNVGTPGVGSITNLVLEWLALSTGTKFQNVPFKGGGPAVQALISGVVPLGIVASSSVAPNVKNGTLRMISARTITELLQDPGYEKRYLSPRAGA